MKNIDDFKKKILKENNAEGISLSSIESIGDRKFLGIFKYSKNHKLINVISTTFSYVFLLLLFFLPALTFVSISFLNNSLLTFFFIFIFLISYYGLPFSLYVYKRTHYFNFIKKIDSTFYENMFNLYNYKEDDLNLIINSMKKKHYANPIEKKIVNYVCNIKEKEINDVFDAKLVSEKPNNVENSDLLKELNQKLSKVSI